MSINYTVIIPHKDTPDLLDRCVQSIPQREDIQIIVVDDCSAEGKAPSEYVHSRAQVLLQPRNQGAGSARNAALPLAQGRWLLFADSDDYFTPNAFCATDAHLESTADVVFFSAESDAPGTARKWKRSARIEKWIETGDEQALRYRMGEPVCKLIKRSFIQANGICFEQTTIHNDAMFSLLCGYYAGTVEIDPAVLYHITDRAGGVSLTVNENKIMERIGVFSRMDMFMRAHLPGMREDRAFEQVWTDIQHGRHALAKKDLAELKKLGYGPMQICWRMLVSFLVMLGRKIVK